MKYDFTPAKVTLEFTPAELRRLADYLLDNAYPDPMGPIGVQLNRIANVIEAGERA